MRTSPRQPAGCSPDQAVPLQPGQVVVTPRLRLPPQQWDTVSAILDGRRQADWAPDYPTDGDVAIAAWLQRAGCVAPKDRWCHRQVVERDTNLLVGGIGFHGPPADGRVELGYGIAPSRRRRGYATEAVEAMVALAWSDPQVRLVAAATDRENVASQRVLEKAGFERSVSDDGFTFTLRRPSD